MNNIIMHVRLDWRIIPAKRTNHRDWSPTAKAYHASQATVAQAIQALGFRPTQIETPVRLGVIVRVPPVQSGKRKGLMPANIGDWDNYFKAVADCLVYHGYLAGDNASIMRGPAHVLETESGIYLSDRTSTEFILINCER